MSAVEPTRGAHDARRLTISNKIFLNYKGMVR